jgi:hypothetical protein
MSKEKFYINICNPPIYLLDYIENHELISEKNEYWEDKNDITKTYNNKPTNNKNCNRNIQIYSISKIYRDFLKFLIECLEGEHDYLENCYKHEILKKRGRPKKIKDIEDDKVI